MCRSIKPLFNYDPPVSTNEIEAAALQFVRKISGYHKPSKVNEQAFTEAVKEISRAAERLIFSLETNAAPKNREQQLAERRTRSSN